MLNKIKFVFCLIIVIVILLTFSTRSIAASSLGEIISDGSNFINTGVNSNAILPTENSIKETSELLMNILSVLGVIILVIWGMVLGIKFITGSVEEQAEVKKGLFPYGVGCIIIFGAYAIWRIVVTIASQFT